MFAEFDNSNFPLIKVVFSNELNEKEFNTFLEKWLLLYKEQQIFSFIFDTQKMGFVNPKYAIKIAGFIKNLKKLPIQYLEKSIIIINNKSLELLLKLVFSIQKPSNAVYIVYSENEATSVYQDLQNNKEVFCTTFLPK